MSFTGATPPNPPNFSRLQYAEPYGDLDAAGNWTGTSLAPGDRKNPNPPPYFDDGTAGSLVAFAANTAALAGGTSAADNAGGTAAGGAGGTGINNVSGTYPGAANGVVPASTSVAHEGAGTEVVVNATSTNPGPLGQLQTVSVLGAYTLTPNASHASYLTGTAGVATPTTSVASGASNVSGAGTTLLTVTGTNFNRSSVVYVNGVAQTTNYVSATSLTVTNAPKRATAGTLPVTVVNGVGGTPSNATNWTFT
jgi:hypothetical protein